MILRITAHGGGGGDKGIAEMFFFLILSPYLLQPHSDVRNRYNDQMSGICFKAAPWVAEVRREPMFYRVELDGEFRSVLCTRLSTFIYA